MRQNTRQSTKQKKRKKNKQSSKFLVSVDKFSNFEKITLIYFYFGQLNWKTQKISIEAKDSTRHTDG